VFVFSSLQATNKWIINARPPGSCCSRWGLRQSENISLNVGQVQQRENRWVVVDFRGKGGRKRTVPVPAWVKNAIDAWTAAADITEGRIFRSIPKGAKGGPLESQTLAPMGFGGW